MTAPLSDGTARRVAASETGRHWRCGKSPGIVDKGWDKVGIRSQTRLAATGRLHPCRPRICRAGLRPAIMADNVAYGLASRPAD